MEEQRTTRNIRLYFWFQILHDPLFWGPVLISYIVNVGKMPLADLYLMEAVVVAGMVVTEIYSSAWADLVGRKRLLILGAALNVIAIIGFCFVTSPLLVWISNVAIMIGCSLISGANEAFLADTLLGAKRYHEMTRICGRIAFWRFTIVAACSVAAGYLYALSPRLPIILSVPGTILSLAAALMLFEPRRQGNGGHAERMVHVKTSLRFALSDRRIIWIIAFAALIALSLKLWFFTYNPYFEAVGIDPVYYGWLFCIFNLSAAAAGRGAHLAERKLGGGAILVLVALCSSLPIFFMGAFAGQTAVALILCGNLARGLHETFFPRFANAHIGSSNRATVLSIKSSAVALAGSASLLAFGLVLKHWDLNEALILLGLALLVLGISAFWSYRTIFPDKKNLAPAETVLLEAE